MNPDLFKRLEASGNLPTPPGVVVRLLQLTQQANVSVQEISDTIALDPGLTVKILRFVNSPLAGLRREITSLQQAVALVGVRSVKMMALSFSILSSGSPDKCASFNRERFALQSLGCGVSAKTLAECTQKSLAQEAFLAGLLSQIGRSALASSIPGEYAKVLATAHRIPLELPELERKAFGETYASVGAWLLRKWGIPETLCCAVETFRSIGDNSEAPPLPRLLHVGELAMAVICPDDHSEPPGTAAFVEAGRRHLSLSPEQCLASLKEIAGEIEDTRKLFEFHESSMRSIQDVEAEVHERLAELSIAMHLENRSMAVRQEDLLRRATTDPLTGVGNRAAFDARMSLELERSARTGMPFALMMIDVDRFKRFNDTYGHQAGDRVLQAVARLLDENIRKVDYVARYGGEEFAIIAPDASEGGIALLAERLRRLVEELCVLWEGQHLSITISIGVAVFTEVVDSNDAKAIIRAADAQLYAAKCAGRNRVAISVDKGRTGVIG